MIAFVLTVIGLCIAWVVAEAVTAPHINERARGWGVKGGARE